MYIILMTVAMKWQTKKTLPLVSLRELDKIITRQKCQNYFMEMKILMVPIRSTVGHTGIGVLLSLTT
jgi:hypothetical protein